MIERLSYHKRRKQGYEEPSKYLSIIIDGMDQNHSRLPYGGTQASYTFGIPQHLTGVICHGVGAFIYRTYPTIHKGANLTSYIILDQIDKFRERNEGRLPENIYIQLDGGGENANETLLGLLELLVAKNVAKMILFSRLPVGHTHEDIDAMFGRIWEHCKGRPINTPGEYAKLVEEALISYKAEILDIHVIPNYDGFIKPYLGLKIIYNDFHNIFIYQCKR